MEDGPELFNLSQAALAAHIPHWPEGVSLMDFVNHMLSHYDALATAFVVELTNLFANATGPGYEPLLAGDSEMK